MKLQFLCPTHHQQLSTNPSYAISCWQNGIAAARSLIDAGQWHEALPHIGCAFESAEIIMTSGVIPRHQACDIFASSAVKLAAVFIKVDQRQHAQQVYSSTTARLKREQHKYSDCSELVEQITNEVEERSRRLTALTNSRTSIDELTATVH
ncbi:MAG: hypothetical protein ACI90U_002329 [Pseudomonadales bacterium]|jgi:hypothetical protein